VANECRNEEAVFDEAIRLRSGPERDAFLAETCKDNSKLRADVEALIQAHETESILDVPILGPDVTLGDSPISEVPGTVIGRYKLLEKVGEGGMAVVYMAEQEEPIRRKIALKIIKLGMDTKQVIARFEAERQALAMMDHPNIAKVLDAGATETGRPYFVMELVTGVSITRYCDKNDLSTKERLALFIQVCDAVQHAHQKGIIHRDVKPSNVMVTHRDGTPVPKIIDFGIAKAIKQRLTEKTLFTHYAHIIGTPAYMSPEQAELSDLDIDTRSDIYSLGVLLYELLTGTQPFSEAELRKSGYLEMQRIIREEEPTKPSTKLSTLGETLADVAKHRASAPDLLRKAIRGDLDRIVMKTLEKTRDRRYETVSALALDVQRHLSDEPIFARAPSAMYRLHKFLRRHRSQSIVMLIVSVLLAALMIVLLMWNQNRLKVAKVESMAHESILSEARLHFYARNNPALAIQKVGSILDSKHVGYEAQLLYSNILTNAREQISHYTSKIEDNPEDANNYFRRAEYHEYLGDRTSANADMRRWSAVAGGGQPSDLQSGTQRDFRNFVSLPFDFELVLGEPTNLGPPVNTSYGEARMCISPGGLELYFDSKRPGGSGGQDLWVTTRATIQDEWGEPVNLGATVNSADPVVLTYG
jgi:serine/threonine protein kinase